MNSARKFRKQAAGAADEALSAPVDQAHDCVNNQTESSRSPRRRKHIRVAAFANIALFPEPEIAPEPDDLRSFRLHSSGDGSTTDSNNPVSLQDPLKQLTRFQTRRLASSELRNFRISNIKALRSMRMNRALFPRNSVFADSQKKVLTSKSCSVVSTFHHPNLAQKLKAPAQHLRRFRLGNRGNVSRDRALTLLDSQILNIRRSLTSTNQENILLTVNNGVTAVQCNSTRSKRNNLSSDKFISRQGPAIALPSSATRSRPALKACRQSTRQATTSLDGSISSDQVQKTNLCSNINKTSRILDNDDEIKVISKNEDLIKTTSGSIDDKLNLNQQKKGTVQANEMKTNSKFLKQKHSGKPTLSLTESSTRKQKIQCSQNHLCLGRCSEHEGKILPIGEDLSQKRGRPETRSCTYYESPPEIVAPSPATAALSTPSAAPRAATAAPSAATAAPSAATAAVSTPSAAPSAATAALSTPSAAPSAATAAPSSATAALNAASEVLNVAAAPSAANDPTPPKLRNLRPLNTQRSNAECNAKRHSLRSIGEIVSLPRTSLPDRLWQPLSNTKTSLKTRNVYSRLENSHTSSLKRSKFIKIKTQKMSELRGYRPKVINEIVNLEDDEDLSRKSVPSTTNVIVSVSSSIVGTSTSALKGTGDTGVKTTDMHSLSAGEERTTPESTSKLSSRTGGKRPMPESDTSPPSLTPRGKRPMPASDASPPSLTPRGKRPMLASDASPPSFTPRGKRPMPESDASPPSLTPLRQRGKRPMLAPSTIRPLEGDDKHATPAAEVPLLVGEPVRATKRVPSTTGGEHVALAKGSSSLQAGAECSSSEENDCVIILDNAKKRTTLSSRVLNALNAPSRTHKSDSNLYSGTSKPMPLGNRRQTRSLASSSPSTKSNIKLLRIPSPKTTNNEIPRCNTAKASNIIRSLEGPELIDRSNSNQEPKKTKQDISISPFNPSYLSINHSKILDLISPSVSISWASNSRSKSTNTSTSSSRHPTATGSSKATSSSVSSSLTPTSSDSSLREFRLRTSQDAEIMIDSVIIHGRRGNGLRNFRREK
ncbi:flocculation protein FLO11 [Hyalella azteca]|uniref:Flocculation protein FLO11 n=1 Tax=Hyalella azteca TaxID=294128 RepID=A0A8B7MZ41_HYAAZ|nr:flocculation protein FLO11 [Hyalella azteca]